MDHSAHTPLAPGELTEDNVVGAVIYGPDDEKVGTISHQHGTGATGLTGAPGQTGATGQVVVDVGGFLGIGAKPVALSMSQLTFMRDQDGTVHATTSLTKDQAKALPEHKD